MRVDVCCECIIKNKKLFVNATFLLALCARPYPLPLKQNALAASRVLPGSRGSCGSCGQCGQSIPSRMATQCVDNVDNHFAIVHMIHKAILLCASPD
jgi:hypothetical protein